MMSDSIILVVLQPCTDEEVAIKRACEKSDIVDPRTQRQLVAESYQQVGNGGRLSLKLDLEPINECVFLAEFRKEARFGALRN